MAYLNSRMWREARDYLKDMANRGLCKEYIKQTETLLKRFAQFCQSKGVGSSHNVTLDLLKEYLDQFEGKSASYQRYVYATTRGYLKYVGNPVILRYKYRARGRGRKVRWLSLEETERLLTTKMNLVEAVIVVGGLLQGLRRCEVLALTMWDAKEAVRTGYLTVKGKGKDREVWVQPDFRALLEMVARLSDAPSGAKLVPYCPTHYGRILKRVGDRAGIDLGTETHALRRTCATNLSQAGERLEVIKTLLGHSTVTVTERYIAQDLHELQLALERTKRPKSVRLTVEPVK